MTGQSLREIRAERGGVTLIETAIVMGLLLALTGGIIDFGLLMYRYQSAQRGTQVAARNATLLAPVASGLRDLDWAGAYANAGLNAGDPVLPAAGAIYYDLRCSIAAQGCAAQSGSTIGTSMTLNMDSLNRILYGVDFSTLAANTACRATPANETMSSTTPLDELGLCDFYGGDLSTVEIRYSFDGSGYAYRPDGPVPRVSVVIAGFQYRWIFLGGLIGLPTLQLGEIGSSMIGQANSTLASAP